jgi:hypothetical protein
LTWIKLDDNAPEHPKVAGLSDRAFRWWVRGLCYASRFLTDGLLPFVFTRAIPQKTINELSVSGLWTLGELGWHIHDYVEHQSVKADVKGAQQANRERQRRYQERRQQRVTNGVTNALDNALPNALITRPDIEIEKIQRTETEKTPTVSSQRVRPLVASPLDYDRMHGKHMTGFCGFVCLPMFLFDGWVNRVLASGISEEAARARVNTFCADVMARWKASGQVPGGDELSFWRAEWSNAHPAPALVRPAAGSQRSSTAALRAALAAKGEQP